MPKYQAPRGMRDLLPADMAVYQRLAALANELGTRYGYRQIETPLVEEAGVYERAIGQATDVVQKELFRVLTPGDDTPHLALRPEATAGIARAYVEHGMQTWPQPVRFSSFGPMFRYDRPQAGRYREFWQWNVEAIGDPGPAIDSEIVELGMRWLKEAGAADVQVHLNSIGDANCRPAYIAALSDYLTGFVARLPPTEKARASISPLRVLDSKDPALVAIIAGAPIITDYLCDACRAHYEGVQHHLRAVGIEPRPAPRLVRGLDYYTRTAFEFYVRGAEGSQQSLAGGGRYDGLVELLGGRPTPGVGFAMGVDRVVLLDGVIAGTKADGPTNAYVVGADPAATELRFKVATDLRAAGISARADLGLRKLTRQLEGADREGAHFAVVIGDELDAGQVQLRDLKAGSQKLVNVTDLAREIERASATHRHG
jgi:histidyl-tRNA synthetase